MGEKMQFSHYNLDSCGLRFKADEEMQCKTPESSHCTLFRWKPAGLKTSLNVGCCNKTESRHFDLVDVKEHICAL